jgi:hypothetical protein
MTGRDVEKNRSDEERRRSRRFTCAGNARISLLPSDGIFFAGRILDLCLHGCRIETTLPIHYGARAEIVLRVNATSFRAVGKVTAIRQGLGAGIEFVQLSDGGNNMLEEVVQELARLQAATKRLKSVHRDMDGRSFRRQLEDGKVQAEIFNYRLPVFDANRAAQASVENSALSQTADVRKVVDAEPLVITVDLFV